MSLCCTSLVLNRKAGQFYMQVVYLKVNRCVSSVFVKGFLGNIFRIISYNKHQLRIERISSDKA